MRSKFSNIWKNEFNRNVFILVLGTVVAQAVPVLVAPILTRFYTPTDFGALALFISIISIVSVVSCGRYELAIVLPKKDEEAVNLAVVAFIFNVIVSLSFLLFIFFYGDELLKLMKAEILKGWIYLAPLVVFLLGVFNILNFLNNRFKLYGYIARAKIYKSVTMTIVQLVFGFLKSGYAGLILGHVVAQFVANCKLFSYIHKKDLLRKIEGRRIGYLAKRYIKFPMISTWAGLMNTCGYQLLNILIGIFFGSTVLGYFYLAYKILGVSTSLIGSSIAQVFYQQANEEKIRTGKAVNTFRSTFKKLIVISIIIFTPMFLLAKPLFLILFGEKWEEAGLYAMILVPMFAVRFVSYVFTLTPFIFEKQYVDVIFQLGIFLIIFGIFSLKHFDPTIFFKWLSLCLMVYYGVYIYINYRISKG